MSSLYVFNCDNDLALANFSPGFTPPSTIRQMMDELADLPLAWSESGRPTFNSQLDEVIPWGWSPALCHRLREKGVPESLLPTRDQLLEIRRLSSRERAVELLAAMREEGVCVGFQSVYCTDEAQVADALSRWPSTILKAPWSGSGKGLRYSQGGREDTLAGWYQRIVQQQGGVVVEPLYNKVYDLAMEFWSDGQGCVTYQGLSLFETHPNGAYRGNLLMPEEEKQAWLDEHVPTAQTLAARRWLESRLSTLIGTAYKGYLGVDMMIVNEGNEGEGTHYTLHPMVELNLRMTMGMVSVLLHRRLPSTFHGAFRLEYFPSTEALLAEEQRLKDGHTYYRRLSGGVKYLAYVIGEETGSRE